MVPLATHLGSITHLARLLKKKKKKRKKEKKEPSHFFSITISSWKQNQASQSSQGFAESLVLKGHTEVHSALGLHCCLQWPGITVQHSLLVQTLAVFFCFFWKAAMYVCIQSLIFHLSLHHLICPPSPPRRLADYHCLSRRNLETQGRLGTCLGLVSGRDRILTYFCLPPDSSF